MRLSIDPSLNSSIPKFRLMSLYSKNLSLESSLSCQLCPKQSSKRWEKVLRNLSSSPTPWLYTLRRRLALVAALSLFQPKIPCPFPPDSGDTGTPQRFQESQPVFYAAYLGADGQRVPTFSTVCTLPVPHTSEAYKSASCIWAPKILLNTPQAVRFIFLTAFKKSATTCVVLSLVRV